MRMQIRQVGYCIMLYILFCKDVEEDEAAKLFGKPVLEYPDSTFKYIVSQTSEDVSSDEEFQHILKKIDNADVPMKNVIRDIPTGDTHDIYKTSTGVKTLWLAAHEANYMFLSEWFGPNCYQDLFDIASKEHVYMYDDSDMFVYEAADSLNGVFTDFKTKKIIEVGKDETMSYLEEMGYY